MANWNYMKDKRPTEAGTYAVLAQLDDGTLVEQVDQWHITGRGAWWGDTWDAQDGAVIAWREIDQ